MESGPQRFSGGSFCKAPAMCRCTKPSFSIIDKAVNAVPSRSPRSAIKRSAQMRMCGFGSANWRTRKLRLNSGAPVAAIAQSRRSRLPVADSSPVASSRAKAA